MDGFIKKTGQSAKDAAIKAAKRVAQEPVEILSHTKAQVVGTDVHKEPLVNEMLASGSTTGPTPLQEQQIHAQGKRRLQELEAELARMRQKRATGEQEWRQQQEQILTPQKPSEQKVFVEPPSKPRRGMVGPGQKKGGTKEMVKQVSG